MRNFSSDSSSLLVADVWCDLDHSSSEASCIQLVSARVRAASGRTYGAKKVALMALKPI